MTTPMRVKENSKMKGLIGQIVHLHEDRKPNMWFNKGRAVVSKQPNSPYVFIMDFKDLEKVN